MKKILFFGLLLLLINSERINAQVVFNDPTPNPVLTAWFTVFYSGTSAAATTPQQIPTPSAGTSTTMYFTAKLFRNKGTQTAGYVDVFAGTSSTALSSAALTNHVQVLQWGPVYDNTGSPGPYESVTVSSPNFTLSSAQASGNTGLYAVYYSTLNGATSLIDVSPPVTIAPPVSTGGGGTGGGGTVTPIVSCVNTLICESQCVNYGALPALLNGRGKKWDDEIFNGNIATRTIGMIGIL